MPEKMPMPEKAKMSEEAEMLEGAEMATRPSRGEWMDVHRIWTCGNRSGWVAMTPERSTDANGPQTDDASQIGPLDVDELFEVLSRPGNRYVLTYLLLEGEPVSLVDLVDYVLEVTEPPSGTSRAEFSGQLLNRFIERTLPELHDRGLVEYDRSAQMVSETEATPLTLPYLRSSLQQSAPARSEQTT